MQQNIIKYYEKITDDALKNLAQGKKFQFRARLTNRNLIMQSEDYLIQQYKKAGGTDISLIRDDLEKYKKAMLEMHKVAGNDYNKVLNNLKTAKDKQKLLDDYANRGIHGFTAKNGAHWNIETYSNMYFTHLSNQMVRQGQIDYLMLKNVDRVLISSHNGSCELCKPYEGRILTWEELEEAKLNGLFHVRCRHFILEVTESEVQ